MKANLLVAFAAIAVHAAPQICSVAAAEGQGIFMAVMTNIVRVTNQVIVTNYVVTTNITLTTNYYNAQGQLLTPVQAGPAAPIEVKPTVAAATVPDASVVRSNRVQALRDLLTMSIASASNALGSAGAFNNPKYQVRIPEGVTVFDRKKAQTLSVAMNTAAEKAVPGAVAVLQKAVAELNPTEPNSWLQGASDAATRNLLGIDNGRLTSQVRAVVDRTATEAHVPEAYNAAMLRGGGLLGAVLGTSETVDMTAHITSALVEALAGAMGSQEALIRADPTLRKTKALQGAFGQ